MTISDKAYEKFADVIALISDEVASIVPLDDREANDQRNALEWLSSGVSLWYVIAGVAGEAYDMDKREFHNCKWFTLDKIMATDIQALDPHLHRFVAKLARRLRVSLVIAPVNAHCITPILGHNAG